jgi:DNA-binding NtrC family response regulator
MTETILVVDDEELARTYISTFLESKGFEVFGAGSMAEAREQLKRGAGDIILLDVQLPDGYGPNLLYETAHLPARPPIIVITGFGDIEMAVDAMKNGAHDFLQKPVDFEQLESSINRAVELVRMRRELAHYRQSQQKLDFVQGKSKEMASVLRQAQRAASASVSVLLTGETGTGKEVLAKFIHNNGPRASKSFIPINCAAIQSNLLESELFGYEAGAFTGAEKRKHGLMELADQGVLFLDEISSMPLDIQAKLLRALESRAFRRVGGVNEIHIDVQVIAASNRDLKQMIKDNQFREDLYYRLKVVDLHLIPLRERKEDIAELVGFMVKRENRRMGMNVIDVTPRTMEVLINYSWPGNIRELGNAIERAMLFCDGEKIDLADLPSDIVHPR